MAALPSGTVTFLFTDVEGSTRLWERYPKAMPIAYARHDARLRDAAAAHGGVVYKLIGDAFQVAFPTAADAVGAAFAAQRDLEAEAWDAVGLPERLRVRMALHAGPVDPTPEGDYRSPVLNRLGRLLGAGYGGQILVSQAVTELAGGRLPDGAELRDLGEHRLKDLTRAEHVFQVAHPALPTDFPVIKTLDARRHNLPVQPTPFIGREGEVAAVVDLLRRPEARLVTLTGPGGTGKTRLGLQVAAELLDGFPDGVYFVDLAPLDDPALLASAIAGVLGVREEGDAPLATALAEHLRDKRLLLLLDNVEHVLAGVPLVAQLLAAAAGLKVLATSRARLQLRGEREHAVPPLALPDPRRLPPTDDLLGFEAVRLFVERAREVKPAFVLDAETAPAVAEICVRLDGLPLAIELAAARAKILAPAALLARLESRLKLLTGGARDLPERQRTLRGAIAWSHDLLAEEERVLFRRLAVFGGGCTLETAEAVVDPELEIGVDVLDGMSSLVDKSLLRQEDGPDGEPRFRMLEMIREFALELLAAGGDDAEVRRRHALAFLDLVETAAPDLVGAGQGEALGRLESEHDNLRAALGWSIAEDAETGLRLGGALWRFWMVRGHQTEGDRWLRRVLEAGEGLDDALRARSLNGAGVLAEQRGDYARARALIEGGLALSEQTGDEAGIADALGNLGSLALTTGDYEEAVARYEAAQALHRQLGDRRGVAITLGELGSVAERRGDRHRATVLYEEAIGLFQAIGDSHAAAAMLTNLGVVAADESEYDRASALYEEALALLRALGDKVTIATVLNNLGDLTLEQGDDAGAAAHYEEALALAREVEDRPGVALALLGIGEVAERRGDETRALASFHEALAVSQEIGDEWTGALGLLLVAALGARMGEPTRAARLFGAAAGLCDAAGDPCSPSSRARFEVVEAAVRLALGEAVFQSEREAGLALSLSQAVAEALHADRTPALLAPTG